jgi:RNA polymerase sigma-70 factor (ECF subfamily)
VTTNAIDFSFPADTIEESGPVTPKAFSAADNYPIGWRKPDTVSGFFIHVTHDTSVELWRSYTSGGADAAEAIYSRYAESLLSLARRRISERLGRRVDPEDIAQSAWRSFFVRASNGAFRIERSGDLWRLLATITVKKVLGQVEFHRAAMRDIHREWAPPAELLERMSRGPSAEEIASADDQLQAIMSRLAPDQRFALELRLQNCTREEIAKQLGRTERTIRRWLDEARQWMEEISSRDSHDARESQ